MGHFVKSNFVFDHGAGKLPEREDKFCNHKFIFHSQGVHEVKAIAMEVARLAFP